MWVLRQYIKAKPTRAPWEDWFAAPLTLDVPYHDPTDFGANRYVANHWYPKGYVINSTRAGVIDRCWASKGPIPEERRCESAASLGDSMNNHNMFTGSGKEDAGPSYSPGAPFAFILSGSRSSQLAASRLFGSEAVGTSAIGVANLLPIPSEEGMATFGFHAHAGV